MYRSLYIKSVERDFESISTNTYVFEQEELQEFTSLDMQLTNFFKKAGVIKADEELILQKKI